MGLGLNFVGGFGYTVRRGERFQRQTVSTWTERSSLVRLGRLRASDTGRGGGKSGGARLSRVDITRQNYKSLVKMAKKTDGNFSAVAEAILESYLTAATNRNVRAVIFDMDGVLCDSEKLSRSAGVQYFRRHHGVLPTEHDFADFAGTGEAAFLTGVARRYGVGNFQVAEAKKHFFEIYINEFSSMLKPFEGVRELIENLRKLGMKTALASSADAVKVQANLRAIGFGPDMFDFITRSDEIANKKPAPDIFLAAAAGLGVDPQSCVVIEDAPAGVEAAKRAKMRCVAVATSVSARQLWDAGADIVRAAPQYILLDDIIMVDETDAAAPASASSE
jgi:HAD superfamily hydrolase (TIGR01509 family)